MRFHRPRTHRGCQVLSRRTGRSHGDGLLLEFRLAEEFRQPRDLLFQCPASCAPCLERDLVLPAFPDQAVDERFGRILQTRPRVFVLARRAADARQVGLVGLDAKVGRAARVEPFAVVGGCSRRRHVVFFSVESPLLLSRAVDAECTEFEIARQPEQGYSTRAGDRYGARAGEREAGRVLLESSPLPSRTRFDAA